METTSSRNASNAHGNPKRSTNLLLISLLGTKEKKVHLEYDHEVITSTFPAPEDQSPSKPLTLGIVRVIDDISGKCKPNPPISLSNIMVGLFK
jgi:hypothetical protein